MTQGFVTVATGDLKYYILAYNLLLSYKKQRGNKPFVIYCDRENNYTVFFDKVIIIKNPHYSFLDKISILKSPAYDQNIFIDADCLIYKNIDHLFDYFPFEGVKCFGSIFPLGSNNGWFKLSDIGEYKKDVKFQIGTHGGIIFFNNDKKTKDIFNKSLEISDNYNKFKFYMFDTPADEPILALSMAINNSPPIKKPNNVYVFLPTAKYIKSNIQKQHLIYSFDRKEFYEDALIIHFQNCNTQKARYKTEINRLKDKSLFYTSIMNFIYKLTDYKVTCSYWIKSTIYKYIHNNK